MQITKEYLRKRYQETSDHQLIELLTSGKLTESAREMAKEILDKRGVSYSETNDLVFNKESREQIGPSGIGGWLLLLIFVLIVILPVSNYLFTVGIFSLAESEDPSILEYQTWHVLKTLSYLGIFFFSGISVFGGLLLTLSRKTSVINKAIVILWLVYPLSLVTLEFIIPWLTIGETALEVYLDLDLVWSLIGAATAATIWTAYLSKSKRVHNTYNKKS